MEVYGIPTSLRIFTNSANRSLRWSQQILYGRMVEVKFLRFAGQAALAKVTEEVAADASLYLSADSGYDNIMVVVWDDRAQTEQHHDLKTGLETIRGITCAVIQPRPLKMQR